MLCAGFGVFVKPMLLLQGYYDFHKPVHRTNQESPLRIHPKSIAEEKMQTHSEIMQNGSKKGRHFHENRGQENDAEKNAVPTSSSGLPGVISPDGPGRAWA